MANVRMNGNQSRMKAYRDQIDTDLEANGLDDKQIERAKREIGSTKLKDYSGMIYPDDLDW